MLKIKDILDHGQKARKSHLKTFSTIRSGATKSQVIEKTKSTSKVLICLLSVKKKGGDIISDLACNKSSDLLCTNLNVASWQHR